MMTQTHAINRDNMPCITIKETHLKASGTSSKVDDTPSDRQILDHIKKSHLFKSANQDNIPIPTLTRDGTLNSAEQDDFRFA